mgnify:CR=1 FL=1
MKKSSRVDNYAYLVFGLAGVVFSILWLCDIVKFEMDDGLLKEHPKLAGILLLFIFLISILAGVKGEVKRLKYKKSSYYTIKNMTDSEIKNRLVLLDEEIKIERIGNLIVISFDFKDGIFELNISEDQFNISFDYTDEELYDSLSEVEKQRLDDMFYEGDPLKVSEKEIFNKFIEYVNTNKEIL